MTSLTIWGQQFGLEVVNYFAVGDEPTFETPSFRRSDAFGTTAREVRGVREAVGINEVHNFGKYLIKGDRARMAGPHHGGPYSTVGTPESDTNAIPKR